MRWFLPLAECTVVLLAVSVLLAQSNPDSAGAVIQALRARRFADALQLLDPALRQSPKNAQLWTLQGLAYSGVGRKKEALVSFQSALKISPDSLPALEGAAQVEYEADGKDAPALLQHVLKLAPGDPTAHAMLGALAARKHNCREAVSHFEQSGSVLESQPAVLRQYGICLAETKHSDQAIAVLQRLIATPGDDESDRLRLAALQLSIGKPADALETLQPALQGQPDSDVLALAGEACEEQKDTPQAVKLLHQAIVQNPRDIDLYLQFADLSFVHQSFQVGIDMIDAGLRLQPNAAELYLARGILFVQLADYDRAEADFEKAHQLDPRLSLSEAARGMVAEQTDNLDKALSVVRAKLSKKPDDALLLYVQADILVQKNPEVDSPDFKLAVASAQRAKTLQPGLVAAHDALANLYLQAGKSQLAIEESRASLRHDPNDQVALYHLIVGLRKTGHREELPALLQQLADLRQKATREEGEHDRYKLIEQTQNTAP
jgi:tetratricopeptide (TPR) repeat protein